MGENVAIVGSRNWPDHEMVRDYIYSLDEDDTVVSGGAKGVDQWAHYYAEKRGLTTLIFPAAWSHYGKKAGLLRNRDIVNACDRMVAFCLDESLGTSHSIKLARNAGKPVLVLRTPRDPLS